MENGSETIHATIRANQNEMELRLECLRMANRSNGYVGLAEAHPLGDATASIIVTAQAYYDFITGKHTQTA